MTSRARPSIVLGALGALTLIGVALAPSAPAAQPAPGRADHQSATQEPGKGDANGDRIADDLAAALAHASPGDRLSVIVQGVGPRRTGSAVSSLHVDRTFDIIRGFAGTVTARQVRLLAKVAGITRVELNGRVRLMDASGNQDYGVGAARSAGTVADGTLDGTGVGICFIDTGIDPNHEQLAGRVVGWKDWVNGRLDPYDDHGHGTHVAGIAAGKPTTSANAAYGGVAPGASLIGAKVLDSTGYGADADVVSAIQWCAARSDVDVISMSLGSPGSDGSDAGSQAADAAVAAGKVVVAAAGNDGDGPSTISSPGVATDTITVGAASDPSALAGSTDTDAGIYLAGFSSRGPTTNPDAPLKPDLVAPGLSVVSAKAGTTNSYTTMSGTSMATPFVSGVVALGLEADPVATPAQVKGALLDSAQDAGPAGPDNDWGHGLVDARGFVAALGAAATGTAAWPAHELVAGTVPAGQTVDYPFDVTTAGQTLGITLKITNGQLVCTSSFGTWCLQAEWSPDLDAYLVNPAGTVVANSRCMLSATNGNCGAAGRFETIGIANAGAGTWKLRVESFAGAGSFQADVFGAVGPASPPPPPPGAPTGLTASATSATAIHLTWTDNSTDETYFAVERCQGDGCTTFATLASSAAAGTTTFNDTGLAGSTSYSYRVRAVNGGGQSDPSNTATAVTLAAPVAPSAPTNLVATAKAYNRVDLSWTDTSTNEEGFRVLRCTGRFSCSNYAVLTTLPADAGTWSDPTVAASTYYYYRVDAFNAAGTSSSAPLKLNTPSQPKPPTPTGLTAVATSTSSIDLTWIDNSTDETGFELQRCVGAKCTSFAALAALPPGTVSYTDTGLSAATSYSYRIRALNGGGASSWSVTATVSTPTVVPLPSAPTDLTLTPVSPVRVDLRWTDTSTNETGFRVWRCLGRFSCSNYSVVATLPASTTSWSDLTVAPNTYYYYRVEVFNEGGSAWSASAKTHTPST